MYRLEGAFEKHIFYYFIKLQVVGINVVYYNRIIIYKECVDTINIFLSLQNIIYTKHAESHFRFTYI